MADYQCGCGRPIYFINLSPDPVDWQHYDPEIDNHHKAELQLEFLFPEGDS